MQEKTNYIEIKNLVKVYTMGDQKVHALAGVTLNILQGTFTVIMGPSGSGKSTLLHLIGGLDRASSGSLIVDNMSLEKLDENQMAIFRRKKIGFIFQSFNLIANMTALENVAFPMRFSGVPQNTRRRRAIQLLNEMGMVKRAHHKPSELSGGQQQRVAIARALVNNPPMILADEPTGNLDTTSGIKIMQTLSDLHQEGRTVIVVTHDPRMRQLATETIYILDGKIVSETEYENSSKFDLIFEKEKNEND